MKHVYRALVLLVVFVVSIGFMQKNIKEVTISFDTTVEMAKATFPILHVKTSNYEINVLHGYSSSIEANVIRESVTPIGTDKNFELYMEDQNNEIRKIKYELRRISENELMETDTISALDETESGKSVKIRLKADLETGREYAVKITAVTSNGRKIHYYTRLKYYDTDSHLNDKMNFIQTLQDSIINKKNTENIVKYLEPDSQADNSSLAYVNINSSVENVTWGNLKPSVITDMMPVIKEFNIETTAVEFDYYISANAGSQKDETYHVKEFYRVRYTNERMYLLYYQRTMEAVFDIALTSITKNELKLGITNETDLEIFKNKENTKLSFVRQGALWYYNISANKAVKVFSFLDNKNLDYVRNGYMEHNIRILNMSDNGDLDFMVYGYFNRGDYEGRVGVLVYQFHADQNRIEELVYIPMETTYQILKEDVNQFGYVSQKGIFYFTLENVIYSYNIIAKKLDIIASNITEDELIYVKDGSYVGWQNSSIPEKAKTITLLNLETEEKSVIEADSGDCIKLLGSSESNILYGFAHTDDIVKTKDGIIIVPLYQVFICNGSGDILKTYEVEDIYVTDVKINENVIQLTRVKKSVTSGKMQYIAVKEDNIINNLETAEGGIVLETRVTDLALTEYYISLPDGVELKKTPTSRRTVNTIITEDTTLTLNRESKEEKYYVYGYGSIIDSFARLSDAIICADKAMGLVTNRNHQIVWERGGKFLRNQINFIEPVYTSANVNSIGASISMILELNGVSASPAKISKSELSISEILSDELGYQGINLTGCTLDQVLYYVSCSSPVIAMRSNDEAVLLTGYDEYYVYYLDPQSQGQKKVLLTMANTIFESYGNIFISYLKQ